MKRITSFIPAACMFIILAGLLVFMCLPQNQSKISAQNGLLDLRGETAIAPLHGEWEFVYGELLTPDHFISSKMDTITVPSSWDDKGYPLNGCATYRLTILTDGSRPLTLFLPEITSAYVLWINGDIVRSCGEVSASPGAESPRLENALLPVSAESEVVELVLQISNYHFAYGGIIDSLLLGESGEIQSWFVRTRVFSAVALGCILMAAFYHLTLFIYRRREKIYLLFALLCFLCFARFLLETNGLNEYFGWLPMDMFGVRLQLFLIMAHSISILLLMLYVFNRDFLKKHRTILLSYFLAILLINILMPINTKAYILVVAAATIPFTIFLIILGAKSPVLKESRVTRLYFAALIVYFVLGTTAKYLFDNVLFMTGLVTNMFLILSQSLVLSRMYTDVQATNTAMKELMSNISHDLKTPLAVMSLNLETLSGLTVTQSDADYQRHVRAAYQKNRDLQRLIQNLFEVSRIETGRNIYSLKWESLLHILAQAKEKYDTFLEDNGILFDITVEDDTEISTDPQKIWSVFDNIIYNAARYTESGGSITITAHDMESSVAITITDTGCGIAPEHLPHIFERFYRGSQARSTNEGESGLGLYIVKSVMEGCGGSVKAESEPDKGTSVILTFPASQLP